jgi:hypothetical protein
MTQSNDTPISGYLLEWPGGVITRDMVNRCRGVEFSHNLNTSGWEEFSFRSPVPLQGELRLDQDEFVYSLVIRRSGARMLLFGRGRNIADHVITHGMKAAFIPTLDYVTIAVDKLVRNLVQKPAICPEYALGFVHARFPAFGAALRSGSFYGDDLADAIFFRENQDLMTFLTCGLRSARGGSEIVRIGARGSVSSQISDSMRLAQIERVLRFLRDSNYLRGSFVLHGHETNENSTGDHTDDVDAC